MNKSKVLVTMHKDMFRMCEDELHLLRSAYNTGSYLLNQYETTVYKNKRIYIRRWISHKVFIGCTLRLSMP